MPRIIAAIALALGFTATPALANDDLADLSTSFDQASDLQAWHEHKPEGFTDKWLPPRLEDDELVLEPVSSGWFEDNQAGHLYQPIDGNFIVTTRIEVSGTNAELPQTPFSLAGLFVRAPNDSNANQWAPGRENWLFFSVGTAAPAGEPQYEIKTTTNSLSTLQITPAQTGWVELRMARHGELFTLLHRPEGQSDWAIIEQIVRPDLPRTLNVGITAYADYASVQPIYPDFFRYNTEGTPKNNADLIARVDYVTFRRPVTGRIPIANIDAPDIIPAIAERRADILSD